MAQSQELQTTTSKKQFDTVIVGAGSAGLVSALALTEAGKQVVVLEKMAKPGGNSIRASSGMNAAKTAVQKHAGIKDTYEAFLKIPTGVAASKMTWTCCAILLVTRPRRWIG